MSIKIREQAGTDAVRKFDYQMAVALDYLLSEIDNDVIVLIETLEDFAIFHNLGTEFEKIDIFQVKTKDKGLYSKNTLYTDNVLGKICLTDFYFDSKANTLNIVCNTALKGTSTETLEDFVFESTLTPKELSELKTNVEGYLNNIPDFTGNIGTYWGKLVYIKSSLPFSEKQDRYSETLVGKTNSIIGQYLGDENHTINPQIVFNTLKILIDKQRRNKITTSEIDVEEAIAKKGISTAHVRGIIEKAAETNHLSKKEIFQHAATIFNAQEFLEIKDEYPTFLSYKANLTDHAFIEAKTIIEEEYHRLSTQYDSLDDVVRNVAYNCKNKISYYSLPIIRIITIVAVYS